MPGENTEDIRTLTLVTGVYNERLVECGADSLLAML